MAQLHNAENVHRSGHVHVVSPKLLLTVYGVLLFLTILTVAVTSIDFGDFNIWVALFVALIKAAVVALYFMHLRWDSPFNALSLIAALFFVVIFIGIAVLDTREYKPNYVPPGNGQVMSAPHAH